MSTTRPSYGIVQIRAQDLAEHDVFRDEKVAWREVLSVLKGAAAASEQVAEEKQIAARRAGREAANAWLTATAIAVRSVLPTAHRLVVDTASWLDQRGENRPDIVEVFDRDGSELYHCYTDVDDGRDLVLDEAGTLLDHALRYADPWTIETGWEGRESECGPTYDVTLPDLPPELEAACEQLAAEGAKELVACTDSMLVTETSATTQTEAELESRP